MKITILNGNPEESRSAFDAYIASLSAQLSASGNEVAIFTLRELHLRYCVGCFGCWVKKPGECIAKDDGSGILKEVIHSDFLLWASPLKMGFPSAELKKMMDKSIPLIHPYITVVEGEAHHVARYEHYPRLGLLMERDTDTDSRDLELVADIFSRTALNMKSRLEFVHLTDQSVEILARNIQQPGQSQVPFARRLAASVGRSSPPPQQITVFNGSPRGRQGNTPILFNHFLDGFTSLPGRSFESYDLVHTQDGKKFKAAFERAECVLLGFPLYTDAMPGIVKAFIETLEPLAGRPGNPPIAFLVQSGFPEAAHSRHIERYLEKLAARLGSPYLGTIVKGGVEGIQIMPEKMTASMFRSFHQIGRTFGETGGLDPVLLKNLAKPERFPAILGPLFKLFLKLPFASMYWDEQLKANGVYAARYARPF